MSTIVTAVVQDVWTAPAPVEVGPQPAAEPDPFVAPDHRTAIADARPRTRVSVAGVVTAAEVAPWAGGPVLEVVVDDGTGQLVLAFTGRQRLAGVVPGRPLVAAGVIRLHRGRHMLMNPAYLLAAGPA